jgi:hypothetical protein
MENHYPAKKKGLRCAKGVHTFVMLDNTSPTVRVYAILHPRLSQTR